MTHFRTVATVMLCIGALGGSTTSGNAEAKGSGPCSQDIERFCPGVQPGQGRYRSCLRQHESELSPACLEHYKATKKRVGKGASQVRALCAQEIQQYCKDISPGEGRILQCLKGREADLSPPCKEALSDALKTP